MKHFLQTKNDEAQVSMHVCVYVCVCMCMYMLPSVIINEAFLAKNDEAQVSMYVCMYVYVYGTICHHQ